MCQNQTPSAPHWEQNLQNDAGRRYDFYLLRKPRWCLIREMADVMNHSLVDLERGQDRSYPLPHPVASFRYYLRSLQRALLDKHHFMLFAWIFPSLGNVMYWCLWTRTYVSTDMKLPADPPVLSQSCLQLWDSPRTLPPEWDPFQLSYCPASVKPPLGPEGTGCQRAPVLISESPL